MSSSEPKGRAGRAEDRRQAIVDAALEAFATRGYRGSALADIAEQVGMTPAGILYHFGTKDALLLAVIAERDRRAAEVLRQLPPDGGLGSLRTVANLAEVIENERGLSALHTVLQAESFEPEGRAHEYFLNRCRLVRSWVEDLLTDARAGGEVAPDVDCAAKATEFVAYLEGASILWLIDGSISLVTLYRGYVEAFITSVTTRREPTPERGTVPG